jgi:hypothetical protein
VLAAITATLAMNSIFMGINTSKPTEWNIPQIAGYSDLGLSDVLPV